MIMSPKQRELIYNKFNGKCAYSGKQLETYQVDHITPKYRYVLLGNRNRNPNDPENLIPCEYILNHYKRGLDLEQWRKYLLTFHLRLAKLPKNTNSPSTQKRKDYMFKVADIMGITVDKPFNGVFYFETLT